MIQKTARLEMISTDQFRGFPWLQAIVAPSRNGSIPLAVGPRRSKVAHACRCAGNDKDGPMSPHYNTQFMAVAYNYMI